MITVGGLTPSQLLSISQMLSVAPGQTHRGACTLTPFLTFCLWILTAWLDLMLPEGGGCILFCILQIFTVICQ